MHTGFHTIQKMYSAEGVREENMMPESNNALTLGAIFIMGLNCLLCMGSKRTSGTKVSQDFGKAKVYQDARDLAHAWGDYV